VLLETPRRAFWRRLAHRTPDLPQGQLHAADAR